MITTATTIISNDFDNDYDYYCGYGYDYDYGGYYDPDYDNEKMGVGRIRTFSFSSDSAYDPGVYDLVQISEAEAEEYTNHNAHSHAL